jgi:hypothetical protein
MTNVITFGKKPKTAPPAPPRPPDGDMRGYEASRRIATHFGIAVSTQDAIKLELQLQRMMAHAYHQGHTDGARRGTSWRALMVGVRVDGSNVVIATKGGNEGARLLCGELVKEIEQ